MQINIPRVLGELNSIDDFGTWFVEHDEGELLESIEVTSQDIMEESFVKADISTARFKQCRFVNCDFEKASFVDVVFENCDFSNSSFVDAYFMRCEFKNCKLVGADYRSCVFKHISINDSLLRYVNMNNLLMEYVTMTRCDLTEASAQEVKHKSWMAKECVMVGLNLYRTRMRGFDFSENEMGDLIVSDSLEELKGSKISPVQAMEVAKYVGVKIV